MTVTKPRRIGQITGSSLYDRLEAKLLHDEYWRSSIDAVEREHPELVIEDDGNLLLYDGYRLAYGFDNQRAFVERFPAMFEKLLPRIRKAGAEQVRFRLIHAPARPVIEPVLKQLWFTPSRDWIAFDAERGTRFPAAPLPAGYRIRDGHADDFDAVSRIDLESFPNTPIAPDALKKRVGSEPLLIAERRGEVVGFCLHAINDGDYGWINVLAVDQEHRGLGIGAALTVRATKRLFASGCRIVGLTTDDGNPAARLYARLGFKQTRAGRDYTRPASGRAIEQIRADKQGTLIRFGGWR